MERTEKVTAKLMQSKHISAYISLSNEIYNVNKTHRSASHLPIIMKFGKKKKGKIENMTICKSITK